MGKRERKLRIIKYPHDILRKECSPIAEGSKDWGKLPQWYDEMRKLLRKNNGIGLAAPQVGIPLQFFIIGDKLFINPIVIEKKGLFLSTESCLSIPNVQKSVNRPAEILVEFKTLQGEIKKAGFTGAWSAVWKHEWDHLYGKLFIDYL